MGGLTPGGGRTLLLSFAHESPEETLAMHERFLRHRLALRAILPGFNRYEGAEILGNSGQLIHLQTTRETLPPSSRAYEGPLYTHEVRPHRGQYRCAACGARVETARGRPISTWKQRGCPACGARTFRREKRRR
ncbi:MAG: hypothetical protein D6795_21090 [Deltaproteobacteria bacterium]|nr:MAG: hypothetical protein D6795_21090 [Deltaproteobacteria bacterium]